MSFRKQVAKFNQKALERAERVKTAAGIELFNSVIMDTPVDTGRARGNWQISLNQEASGTVERSPQEAIDEAGNPESHGNLEDTTILTNNLPYIGKLEYGHSKQAPAGMMRKNVARIQRLIKEQARRIRNS